MIASLKPEMMAYAKNLEGQEACGLIAGGKFWPCKNIHSSPLENFAIDAKAYAKLDHLGIEAVFHSHPGFNEQFSKHDIVSCKQTGLPWVMYCRTYQMGCDCKCSNGTSGKHEGRARHEVCTIR